MPSLFSIMSMSHRMLITAFLVSPLAVVANAADHSTDPPSVPSTNCRDWDFCTPGRAVLTAIPGHGGAGLFIDCTPGFGSVANFNFFGTKVYYDTALNCGVLIFMGDKYGGKACSGSSAKALTLDCTKPPL